MVMMVMFAVGGMMGAIAEVLNSIFSPISINVWVWIVNVVTVILLVVGRYALVEKVSMGLVVAFTILTVSCAVLLFKTAGVFFLDRTYQRVVVPSTTGRIRDRRHGVWDHRRGRHRIGDVPLLVH